MVFPICSDVYKINIRKSRYFSPSVAERVDRDIAGSLSFSEEMRQRGLAPQTRLLSARPEAAGEAVAEALGLEIGAPVLFLERLRLAAGVPMLLERASLPAERFPGLLAEDFEHRSLYDVLAANYDTPVVRARELLEPVLLRAREARLLGVPRGRPALLVEGIAYTTDGSPVEFARSWVRGDQTRYYVERVVSRSLPAATSSRGPIGAVSGGRSRP